MEDNIFDHYIAIDWAMSNMAIARMTKKSNKITVIDVPSDVSEAKLYLENLAGTKILAIEETTTSQWLYTELRDEVDKIVICDPYRNRLLNEGPKTDKIDASKLVQLLKAGLMKEVYHSGDSFLRLRRFTSGYQDLVMGGVRLKNQRHAFLRACGKNGRERGKIKLPSADEQFVLEGMERQIKFYEEEKKGYEKEFAKLARQYPAIRHQASLPGIGLVGAIKIVSRVVCPQRFADKGHYLSYAGLVKLERVSGGRSYGKKNPRYSRQLKSVYKSGAFAALGSQNFLRDYYEHLIREKGYEPHNARHKIARRLAVLSLGIFKSGKRYQSDWRDPIGNHQV